MFAPRTSSGQFASFGTTLHRRPPIRGPPLSFRQRCSAPSRRASWYGRPLYLAAPIRLESPSHLPSMPNRSLLFSSVTRALSPEGDQNFRFTGRACACSAICRASTGSTYLLRLAVRRPAPSSDAPLLVRNGTDRASQPVPGGFPAPPLTTDSADVALPLVFCRENSISDGLLTVIVRTTTTFERRSSPHPFKIAASATFRSRAVNSVTKKKEVKSFLNFSPFPNLRFFDIFLPSFGRAEEQNTARLRRLTRQNASPVTRAMRPTLILTTSKGYSPSLARVRDMYGSIDIAPQDTASSSLFFG